MAKRAWEYDYEVISNAVPTINNEVKPVNWETLTTEANKALDRAKGDWWRLVSESRAPYRLIINAIMCMYNMGYDVTAAEDLIPEAIKAWEADDKITLLRLNSKIMNLLYTAKPLEGHPYWKHTIYESFEQLCGAVTFGEYPGYKLPSYEELYDRMYAGWIGEIAGAALGTALEGYQYKHIKAVYGEVRGYIKYPETYNDDITYELALLKVFQDKGFQLTSDDLAEEWVAIIPFGFTAEEVALINLKLGIYPPRSGYHANPYREMVGAPMRAAVCGALAPGNPKAAAYLAWTDGVVSHHNNGVLGEVFNALLVSMAYVETDMKTVLLKAVDMIPRDSECWDVLQFSLDACKKHSDYVSAWLVCEDKYKDYNWVHTYPNLAAEVVAIWFAGNGFDEMMHILAMVGQDVDCTAGPVGHAYGAMLGTKGIGKNWTEPLKDNLDTYVRGMEKLSIKQLSKDSVDALIKHYPGIKNI